MRGFFAAWLLILAPTLAAQTLLWSPIKPQADVLIYDADGQEMVDWLMEDQAPCLTGLQLPKLGKWIGDRSQRQLMGYLGALHGPELSKVLSARGADFAPALEALKPGFAEAFKNASVYRQIQWQLDAMRYQIETVEVTRLSMFAKDDKPNFDADLSLTLSGCHKDLLKP
jgi:hypothetical protein